MARLISFTVERYRNFRLRSRFEVAPLTILIGKNGSGKSVLSRLSMLLSDSLHHGERDQPIRLVTWGVRHAIEYSDIPHMKTSMPFELGMEVKEGDTIREFSARIRYVKERDRLVLEAYTITEDGNQILNASISDEEQLLSEHPSYTCKHRGIDRSEELIGFFGLLPAFTGQLSENLTEALNGFKSALPPVSYLGPFRTEVGHFIGSPRPNLERVGVKGGNAIEIICDNQLRSTGDLLKSVSNWFENAMGHSVSVVKNGDYARISLHPADKDLAISLSETGAGFSQVLPIAVQNFVARSNEATSKSLVVEQPELHLHPAVHGEIADLYLSTACMIDGATIIETHSEEIIMRLRRRIAEGLSSDFVQIWSVGHSGSVNSINGDVKRITFDNQGNPSDWPDGVFEESFRELAEIRVSCAEETVRITIESQTLEKESLYPIFDVVLRFVESGRHSFDVDAIDKIENSNWGAFVEADTIDLIKSSALSASYVSTEQNPLVVIDDTAPLGGEVNFEIRRTRVQPLDAVHFLALPFALIVENEVYDGSFLLWMAKAINKQSFISAYREIRFQFRHAGGKGWLSSSSRVFSDGVWPRSDGAYSRALRMWNGVMLDSDSEFTGHRPNEGIVNACQETTAWVHELHARSIENYIPKETLLKFLPNGADRTRVYKYFELSEEQRRHYNLKKGLSKGQQPPRLTKAAFQADLTAPIEVRELYHDVPEDDWDFLLPGFGANLSQVFVEERYRPNTGAVELPTAAAREEVEAILDKVLRSV